MGLRDMIIQWLGIVPLQSEVTLTIKEDTTHYMDVMKNKVWYRGDPNELEQFYKQMVGFVTTSDVYRTRFWAAVTANNLVRKYHMDIPRRIVDKLSGIVMEDMQEPEMDPDVKARWDTIVCDTFEDLLRGAITDTLVDGDGAFKISVDPLVSDQPLIEFYSGYNVDYVVDRGKLMEIVFKTEYYTKSESYMLHEYYGRGYVEYKLTDVKENKEYPLDKLKETEHLEDVTYPGEFIMAVPMKFFKSAKYPNRGESVFEGKEDTFDSLDEAMSTWVDAMRAGRVKQYIPDDLIPRNEDDGTLLAPDVFNNYVVVSNVMTEDAENKIETVQGDVQFEGLLTSYTTFLDAALQGLISPSTLGIDVKKLDNAESQREKEKTTLYTRDTLIGALADTLPKLVDTVLRVQDTMKMSLPPEVPYKASFEWGQYANPSFEAMVETVGKAKSFRIMSTEQVVDQLYGDTMDDEDKALEVIRIKAEESIELEPIPVGDEELEE